MSTVKDTELLFSSKFWTWRLPASYSSGRATWVNVERANGVYLKRQKTALTRALKSAKNFSYAAAQQTLVQVLAENF